MTSLKVIGAGSAGNHLAHAARQMGWDVLMCDVDPKALERTEREIYPGRYGSWDPGIQLAQVDLAPRGGFDVIFIATPPDRHMELGVSALEEGPRVLLIEKPLGPPSLAQLDELEAAHAREGGEVLVGYDHTVGLATRKAEELVTSGAIGEVLSIDVEFREHWAGIFAAHPWLKGPQDSYLGSWRRGGGAGGEHSHGINLWQHFAHFAGAGSVKEVDARVSYESTETDTYDSFWFAQLETESGMIGRVAQDVVTRPPRKRAVIQGSEASLEWVCGFSAEGDAVILHRPGAEPERHILRKTRADDFLEEVRAVDACLRGETSADSLQLQRATETMLVLAAGHESERLGARVEIQKDRTFVPVLSAAATTSGGGF